MIFQFPCPVCAAPLEATSDETGRGTACPICGQGFPIPGYDDRNGMVVFDKDRTPPRPTESMAYLHAYAADGRPAPQIVRGDDGVVAIRCSRCNRLSRPDANWCGDCRMPFAVETGATSFPASSGEWFRSGPGATVLILATLAAVTLGGCLLFRMLLAIPFG